MNKILMITYYFPPESTAGAVRAGKFAQYLPEFGWQPYILTTIPNSELLLKNNNYFNFHVSRIPSHQFSFKGVSRISKLLPLFWYESRWQNGAIAEEVKLIKENNIDIVWSSALPPICHIIGSKIKERTGIPLVLDYRDLWSLNPYSKRKLEFIRKIDLYKELEVLGNSDLVIAITEDMKNSIQRLSKKILNISVISNRFDPNDMDSIGQEVIPFLFSHVRKHL